ncbi:hypothetical protein OPW41_14480 [Vibrio europaeus]|uniref:hypothetical protein n=1 Tax=Vibrio europaeus TaxID=300876 RepID=UPI00233EDD90|nr:hypothetical protein [Vibrio europaeus]MDC5778096.1 hypothetical protein [Vibrio europaeus]MDC5796038.1 hypothetical protein [Vibrio europaeus]MDC5798667.1 hypothetical protein [Vibrio europaeus]MDC5814174.1 hypothetical protein [Vibrio europaeus]
MKRWLKGQRFLYLREHGSESGLRPMERFATGTDFVLWIASLLENGIGLRPSGKRELTPQPQQSNFSYPVIQLSSYPVIQLSSYPVIQLSSYPVIQLSGSIFEKLIANSHFLRSNTALAKGWLNPSIFH